MVRKGGKGKAGSERRMRTRRVGSRGFRGKNERENESACITVEGGVMLISFRFCFVIVEFSLFPIVSELIPWTPGNLEASS